MKNVFELISKDYMETFFKRPFGYVYLDDETKVELLIVANIIDLEESISINELPVDGNFQLQLSLIPDEKFLSKKLVDEANSEDNSVCSDTIINVHNYMGGLRYEPNYKLFFKTFEEAESYLKGGEFNSMVDSDSVFSGFIMDRYYNRAGDTNWDVLHFMVGLKDRMF